MGPATAQDKPPEAPPITNNQFTLQYYQGPILMSGQVLGMGGAYAPLAQGVEGAYAAAASPSIRTPFSVKTFDFEISAGFSLPGSFTDVDFENRGEQGTSKPAASRFRDAITVNVGANLQYGDFGITVVGDIFSSGFINEDGSESSTVMQLNRFIALGGWRLLDGQLALGAGVRSATINFVDRETALTNPTNFLQIPAFSPQFGATVMPTDWPFRVSATYRAPVYVTGITGNPDETKPDGTQVASGRILPERIAVPWEIEAGVALQVGPKPLNPRWLDPRVGERAMRAPVEKARAERRREYDRQIALAPPSERARIQAELEDREADLRKQEEHVLDQRFEVMRSMREARSTNWPRSYVLVSLSVLAVGGTPNSVGLESFLDQIYEPFGASTTYSVRGGVEGEPVADWLRLRAGTYIEPSRYANGTLRQHFTAGSDIRLFTFDPFGLLGGKPWQLRLAVDVAPRYFNYGLSIGAWR